MNEVSTSIVCLNWDHARDLTVPFVEYVAAHTPYSKQLIVVDQGSNDDDVEELKRLSDKYRWMVPIFLPFNVGFPQGCNIGAKAASGDVLIWMNNDIIIFGDWLGPILERLSDARNCVVGASLIRERTGWNTVRLSTMPLIDKVIPYIEGWLFAVWRESFVTNVGYFDEAFGIGSMEDVDLSWRAHRRGYDLIAVENLPLQHLRGITVSDGRLDQPAITMVNYGKFVAKVEEAERRCGSISTASVTASSIPTSSGDAA